MQKLTTTGNATIIAYDDKPLLVTDPWMGDEEPAYFGSWVLSHRIPRELKEDIARCEYVWFSHGHPDHFDERSLERLPGRPILVVPRGLGARCTRVGVGARNGPPGGWSLRYGPTQDAAVPSPGSLDSLQAVLNRMRHTPSALSGSL